MQKHICVCVCVCVGVCVCMYIYIYIYICARCMRASLQTPTAALRDNDSQALLYKVLCTLKPLFLLPEVLTHRLLSNSFLGLPYRILNLTQKKELYLGAYLGNVLRNFGPGSLHLAGSGFDSGLLFKPAVSILCGSNGGFRK